MLGSGESGLTRLVPSLSLAIYLFRYLSLPPTLSLFFYNHLLSLPSPYLSIHLTLVCQCDLKRFFIQGYEYFGYDPSSYYATEAVDLSSYSDTSYDEYNGTGGGGDGGGSLAITHSMEARILLHLF